MPVQGQPTPNQSCNAHRARCIRAAHPPSSSASRSSAPDVRSSARSTPAMPWCAAQCKALRPPTRPRAAAPAASSCSAQRRCPPARAASRGLVPCESAAFESALRRSSASTTCACPASAARAWTRVHSGPSGNGPAHARLEASATTARGVSGQHVHWLWKIQCWFAILQNNHMHVLAGMPDQSRGHG